MLVLPLSKLKFGAALAAALQGGEPVYAFSGSHIDGSLFQQTQSGPPPRTPDHMPPPPPGSDLAARQQLKFQSDVEVSRTKMDASSAELKACVDSAKRHVQTRCAEAIAGVLTARIETRSIIEAFRRAMYSNSYDLNAAERDHLIRIAETSLEGLNGRADRDDRRIVDVLRGARP